MTPDAPATEATLERVRALVLEHGWNSTVYQLLNPGIRHWFSADGDAAVGYATHAGVRVVAGAPVAPVGRLREVAAEFEAQARARGERTCYFGAEGRLEELCRDRPGYASAVLGAQPAWDPAGWRETFDGRASLRAQRNRARNKGVAVERWAPERARGHPQLRRCLDEWLAGRGLPPLGFLTEPRTLDRLEDRRVHVALRDDEAIGFLVASPVPCRSGWLIEQVIRGRDAPNGTSELLIDAAAQGVAAEGARYLTLGLAPLARRPGLPRTVNPLWLRISFGWARAHGRRFYDFEGLESFKDKFRPDRWEPVFAISDEAGFSPRTLYAIAGAFTGGAPIRTLGRGLARALGEEGRRVSRALRS